MKFRITSLLLLTTLVLVFALFTELKTNLREMLTAAVANIEMRTLRDWSYSGGFSRKLTLGDRGQDVFWLQKALKTDQAIYPEGLETGFLGNATKSALLKFQSQYNLPLTGVLDHDSKMTLNEIFLYELCPKIITEHEKISILTRVDKSTALPINYVPPNLQKLPHHIPKTSAIICLREDVVPYLETMISDAERKGMHLIITSGFRSYRNQDYLFGYWRRLLGIHVENVSAHPGFSEHQLGTTIDLTSLHMRYSGLNQKFADTAEYAWLQKNAHEYGFTMSYPKNKEHITNYSYEPWHWRYVGRDIATKLKKEKRVLSEIDVIPTMRVNLR